MAVFKSDSSSVSWIYKLDLSSETLTNHQALYQPQLERLFLRLQNFENDKILVFKYRVDRDQFDYLTTFDITNSTAHTMMPNAFKLSFDTTKVYFMA